MLKAVSDGKVAVRKVFLGAKKVPGHFEAVVIYHTTATEVNFIKDEIQRYGEAPIRAYLSRTGVPAYSDAGKGSKAFAGAAAAELLQYLRERIDEMESVMRKAFQAFDKDGSGFIDKAELKLVSKECGRELDPAEVEECLRDLDINKDGKITFDEFTKWWLSGRQSRSPWMRRILSSKLKTQKFVD